MAKDFFNIDSPEGGIQRQLGEGIATTVFAGEQAMVSIVRVAPGRRGSLHHHPEEQWGYCIAGSGVRIQGDDEVAIGPGDFWRTPSGTAHTIIAGKDGLVVLDVFAPPRKAYLEPGSGFAASS